MLTLASELGDEESDDEELARPLKISFSSRRHLARLLENHTWILDSGRRMRLESCSRENASG